MGAVLCYYLNITPNIQELVFLCHSKKRSIIHLIEMLQFAGYGIAMGNASDDCKAAAKYETLSNGEDGIAAAIEKFIFNASKPKLLISACLLGENCKYNGGNNYTEEAAGLKDWFELIPICPECFGGLSIPRVPNEIVCCRAISK